MLEGMKMVMPTRRLERQLWQQGFARVVGVDEVGRGPLAGPVTVAAVLLLARCKLAGVRDSKAMSAIQRLTAARAIRQTALGVGIGWASSGEIDRLGLTAATRMAAVRALSNLPDYERIVLDGKHNYLGEDYAVTTLVKADSSCMAVAAASVVAKVARDRYMELIDQLHPQYRLAANKGYGSVAHLAALERYGPTPYHRHSYAPVRLAARVDG